LAERPSVEATREISDEENCRPNGVQPVDGGLTWIRTEVVLRVGLLRQGERRN
jgi:hypothetical protein